jgi:tetratricopeptide (TPR) repeat protein
MPDGSEFDVFISYSSRDGAWVKSELLPRIEQAGLKAFIDYRDFTRGAPSIKEMQRGVVECRKTLVVLTPDYVQSEWCDLESIMAQTLSPANRDLRIIPLLKQECEKPLYVGALTHIDFTDGADLDLAWRQLLTALGKPPTPPPPKVPERDDWFLAHPYPMPPHFTGRVAECKLLTRWLATDAMHPLLSLRALGGFGKSALAWHWLMHDVDPAAWPRVVWWSFYEGDACFDHFLVEVLEYLGGERIDPTKLSVKNALKRLLGMLHPPGTLLVLDGFERVLRAFSGLNAAYQGDEPGSEQACSLDAQRGVASADHDRDCLSPVAELFLYNVALLPNLRSKVLLTTRLLPRVLEARGGGLLQGCRDEELRQMQPADAVEFFRARGIRGTHTEIEDACAPYGYHPLSLGLLAGLIVGDFQMPGDIAAAQRLDVSGDLVQRQHHVLETAYDSLETTSQALLGRIACFRSPVKYQALQALATAPSTAEDEDRSSVAASAADEELGRDLRDLVARGLLHHDTKEARFDLHPIVRRYAYDRLAAPDRATAHTRMRDYFAAVPPPDKVTRLEDLLPVIELYHHTVRAGQYDEALYLYWDRIADAAYFQLGAYLLTVDLLSALFPDGEDRPPRLKDERDQARTLSALANSCSVSGQPRRAVSLMERCNAIGEKRGDERNLAIGLGNLADDQLKLGLLRAAETNLRRSIALAGEVEDEFWKAIGHQELGRLMAYRGVYADSDTELATAVELFEKQRAVQSQCVVWAYRAWRDLFRLRSASQSATCNAQSAIDSARRALELADEWARTEHPNERDYVRTHWLLGAAYRVAGKLDDAERHLHQALERCRGINAVDVEADILVDLGRLSATTGAPDEAKRLAEEALVITDRSTYVLQGADAHLLLATLALSRGDRAAAKEHAQQAEKLAACDGPPDYTYEAAYGEARALLAQLA